MADNFPSLMDVARQSGDKKVQSVVEVLNQTNEALDDIPWIECNSGVTHITTVRTGLPTATWRKLNSGVPTSGTQTKQIKAGTGMLEVYAEVDKKLVDLSKRKSNFIANRNKAFIEGMGQEMARVMFYGDPANPEEPVGFVNYYNDLNAESGKNILDGGGTGADNTSIWLICWGEDGLHGLYPSGTTAGLKEEYLGQVTLRDKQGGQYEGYRTHYEWNGGFVVTDWRCATRIANVDVTKLVDSATDAADLATLMIQATHKLPKKARSMRKAFYCREEVLTALDLQTRKTTNLMLSYQDVFGKQVLTFRGIPIRQADALLATEARVQ